MIKLKKDYLTVVLTQIYKKEANMIETKLPSTDGKNELHVYTFVPDMEIRAILQISHGMIEHISRYKDFANYMNSKGILVIGNDHLGHGLTAKDSSDLGYFGSNHSKTVVDDLYEVTKYAKETYGNDKPYFLLGHSMGSFMARRYLMTRGNELTGAIISGTGSQPGIVLSFGQLLVSITSKFKSEKHRPKLLKTIAFSSYNNRIPNAKTPSDWLSRDEEIVNKYINDPFCTFEFTTDGYKTLFESIAYIQKKENINRIPKDLPILMFSGLEDPVGNYGKGVKTAYNSMINAGIKDITIILYEDGRHEMLNELNRQNVYEDVFLWIDKLI